MSTQEIGALIESVNEMTATVVGKMGQIDAELQKIPGLVEDAIDLVLTLGPNDNETITSLYNKYAAAGRKVTIQLQAGTYSIPERIGVNADARLELVGLSSNRDNTVVQINAEGGGTRGIFGVWSSSSVYCRRLKIESLSPARLVYLDIGSNQAYFNDCDISGVTCAGESTYGFNSYYFNGCNIEGVGGKYIENDVSRSKSSVNTIGCTTTGFHADSIYNGIVE
ncbi:hypothetical protein ABLB82_22750 [Vibrio parahaemolyticus]